MTIRHADGGNTLVFGLPLGRGNRRSSEPVRAARRSGSSAQPSQSDEDLQREAHAPVVAEASMPPGPMMMVFVSGARSDVRKAQDAATATPIRNGSGGGRDLQRLGNVDRRSARRPRPSPHVQEVRHRHGDDHDQQENGPGGEVRGHRKHKLGDQQGSAPNPPVPRR